MTGSNRRSAVAMMRPHERCGRCRSSPRPTDETGCDRVEVTRGSAPALAGTHARVALARARAGSDAVAVVSGRGGDVSRHSDRPPRRCPDLSQPVPTSVPTSGLMARGCPNRPNLFRARAYGVLRPHLHHTTYIRLRCGRLGRLGQANGGAGFSVPTLPRWLGRLGRRARVVWLVDKSKIACPSVHKLSTGCGSSLAGLVAGQWAAKIREIMGSSFG